MFTKEAALLQQIADSRAAIRQKHLQLKHGLQDVQEEIGKVFKPIVQPLEKMANSPSKRVISRVPKNISQLVKNEPASFKKKKPLVKTEKKFFHSTPWKNCC